MVIGRSDFMGQKRVKLFKVYLVGEMCKIISKLQ